MRKYSGHNGAKQTLGWKDVVRQQWYMTKFCFSHAPGVMIYHLFESIKLQVSIFLEFNLAVNYILGVVENQGEFRDVLWCMGLLMIGIAISTVTFAVYMHYISPKFIQVLYKAFRMEIYQKSKELDLAYYDDPSFYEKFILATEEADKCVDRYMRHMDIAVGRSIRILVSVIYCFFLNPLALVITIFTLPIELLLVYKENEINIRARMERLAYEQKREYGNRVFYLADYAKDLRLNPEMKEKCRGDYKESNERICEINRKYGKKLFAYEIVHEVFLYRIIREGLTWTLLLYQMLVWKTLSAADLFSSHRSIGDISYCSGTLLNVWREASENAVYISQIRELLSLESSVISKENKSMPPESGTLSVEHVDFAYMNGKPVLNDICLNIRTGQKIALVGYNGSGKSTLVKLLLRLYDPTSGRICLSDEDIRNYEVNEYRGYIGSVFQDFKIYAATLKENVLMDVENGMKEENYEVEKALYDARFTLEDRRLLYQIETPLTTEFEKDGINLSGGEAQKIAIARTLYRRQKIIIMDEPSSALDPLAEYRLNQELNEIAEDKTVIFISHRLSTTRDADCIYMMEKGRIIESGTHQELLDKKGKYAEMWNVQAGLYS